MKRWSEMTLRERDALVAEKVMGFQWGDLDNGNEALMPPFNEIPWCLTSWHTYDKDGYHTGMPSYTTDIAAAWEVVEKMQSMGFDPTVNLAGDLSWDVLYGDKDSSDWHANFTKRDEEGMITDVNSMYAPTAPEAISLAALKAMGVDVE